MQVAYFHSIFVNNFLEWQRRGDGRRGGGRNFKAVSVELTPLGCHVGRFFAGQPRSPGSRTAGTVAIGANQAEELVLNFTLPQMVDDRGGASDERLGTMATRVVDQ